MEKPINLATIEQLLLKGIQLSKQPSLGRRSADAAAVPYVLEARDRLREHVSRDPADAKAWRLLSRAHEVLMNYREAMTTLETAMKLDAQPSRQDLKRAALLREQTREWQELPFTPGELASLGDFLRMRVVGPEERSFRWTEEWLREQRFSVPEIIDALRARGASSDFQVLYNIVRG
ncbi:MAG TPA: hypothetical protein VFV49_08280 [Thermoanaerobaculia bacterium]|nr:hypothetical protein [Thermoanaerobaculia bacterium]